MHTFTATVRAIQRVAATQTPNCGVHNATPRSPHSSYRENAECHSDLERQRVASNESLDLLDPASPCSPAADQPVGSLVWWIVLVQNDDTKTNGCYLRSMYCVTS